MKSGETHMTAIRRPAQLHFYIFHIPLNYYSKHSQKCKQAKNTPVGLVQDVTLKDKTYQNGSI